MNERLARHLLARLRNEAECRAIEAALEAGIVGEEHVASHGGMLRVFGRGLHVPQSASAAQVTALLRRRRRRTDGEASSSSLVVPDFSVADEDEVAVSAGSVDGRSDPGVSTASAGHDEQRGGSGLSDAALLRAVRASAEPPFAYDVATALLVGQAVPDEQSLHKLLDVLRLREPIVTVFSDVNGFEEGFLGLLKRGLLLPGPVATCDGYSLSRRWAAYKFSGPRNSRWQVISFAGSDADMEDVDRPLGAAGKSSFPILGIADDFDRLPLRLLEVAQSTLSCGGLTEGIVRRTIEAVLGEPPVCPLDGIDLPELHLSDLAVAIRPGVSPDGAVEVLRKLARKDSQKPPRDEKASSSNRTDDREKKEKKSTSSSTSSRRTSDPGSGSELIEPDAAVLSDGEGNGLRIETLSGYGEAREWALELKEELPKWREGTLPWDELATRILLAGPPGTGKTQFAKALCNSLQIPLLATSVAIWLEPSYLGDVVKRMRKTFEEAEAHAPSILFVDEFDGIGRRGNTARNHDEYWNTVINRLLEILDGVKRRSGVIVVAATNNAGAIDPALLRSGRIETHIEIPRPDAEARAGILRHHLGRDLEAVVATAPTPAAISSTDDAARRRVEEELRRMPEAMLRALASGVGKAKPAANQSRKGSGR